MKQIRIGTFETNSSSTHTLAIVSKEQFDKFKSGGLYMDLYSDEKFYTKEDVSKVFAKEIADYHDGNVDNYIESNLVDYDGYQNTELETFEREYETEHGDKIVAFGKYGCN